MKNDPNEYADVIIDGKKTKIVVKINDNSIETNDLPLDLEDTIELKKENLKDE
jgi:hypothetical protein